MQVMTFEQSVKMVDSECQSTGLDKNLQHLWCEMHKCGCVLPSSDELMRLGKQIFPDKQNDMPLPIQEIVPYGIMVRGFNMLIQLAYAKERM